MTTIHLSRDERLAQILKSAAEIVMEAGIEAATITAIANRSGVSRQWLYEFFPDMDSIMVALYQEAQREYFPNDEEAVPRTSDFLTQVQKSSARLLKMPVAFAMVTSHALNGGARVSETGASLRDFLLETYEDSWVVPLVAVGFTRDEIYASIMTITNVAVGLNVAVHDGLTTMELAETRLNGVIASLIGNASSPLEDISE